MMSKPNVSQRPRNQDEERDTVRALSMALRFAAIQRTDMRKILETEEHVPIPPIMYHHDWKAKRALRESLGNGWHKSPNLLAHGGSGAGLQAN